MSLGVGLYVKNSREAVKLYQAAFGAELGYHVLNEDGGYFHSELMVDGDPLVSVCEAVDAIEPRGNPVELGVFFQTRDEVDRAFSLLRQGAHIIIEPKQLPWSPWAACLVDRFGVRWFLSLPNHRPPEDFKPGDEQ